jgi:OOP family OmpA-OmpF porin
MGRIQEGRACVVERSRYIEWMSSLLLALSFALGADPVRYELEGNELKVPGPVRFETGSAKLKDESYDVITYVQGYLEAKPYISLLRVEVHTDAQGADVANQKMSEARALAVVEALVRRGIACERLIAVGFGETKPLAPNDSPEGRAQNRRTVFVNAALKGRPIGGMPVDGGGKVAGDSCAAKK